MYMYACMYIIVIIVIIVVVIIERKEEYYSSSLTASPSVKCNDSISAKVPAISPLVLSISRLTTNSFFAVDEPKGTLLDAIAYVLKVKCSLNAPKKKEEITKYQKTDIQLKPK